MKFGRNLPRNQVPEWSAEYIDYKGLKKLIKSAAEQSAQGSEPDLAAFLFSLDRSLEAVDGFYNKKYAEATRRLKHLSDRYGADFGLSAEVTQEERDDLMAALLELRSQLRKLKWYGEVNRRGFVKITKKLDKKVGTACAQDRYLATRVNPRPFAQNTQIPEDLNVIFDWISKLLDAKIPDDDASTTSSIPISLSRRSSNHTLDVSPELVRELDQSIRQDDVERLASSIKSLKASEPDQPDAVQKFFLSLLQHAIALRATRSVSALLKQIKTLSTDGDLNQRNAIHRFIITAGRARTLQASNGTGTNAAEFAAGNSIVPAEPPALQTNPYGLKEIESSRLSSGGDDTAAFITYLLGELSASQRTALSTRDIFGRVPLHYAAKYGFVSVSHVILNRMIEWGQLKPSDGLDCDAWQDLEGYSPLHLSVIGGWRLTTETLLEPFTPHGQVDGESVSPKQWAKSNLLLSMATKVDFANIVRLLAKAGADVNYQDEQGETPLHVAARFGHVECCKALLEGSKWQPVNTDIPEKTFGWTPLLVACVDGHRQVAEMLIKAGADVNKLDSSGWSAQEHAALRGHLDIAEMLAKYTKSTSIKGAGSSRAGSPSISSLEGRASNGINKENATSRTSPGVKSFGHRYLTDESMVLVSLGSMDPRKNVQPVQLENVPIAEAHATQLDTALSMVVSATGATGEPTIIDLPVQDSVSTEPIAFNTRDMTKVKLFFDIVPTYAGSYDQVVGRGVAVLSSIKHSIGSKRMNLQGDISVPIISAKSLDILGSVNFNFLIVTPFAHPNMAVAENKTYWKSLTAPMVIGHRGLGKNVADRRSLQLGENTMQSFIAAANLGASYVEFDVQLTKDLVPVIYHDFLVSETGIDAPVHALTLEQFLHVNESLDSRESRASTPVEAASIAPSPNRGNGTPPRRVQRAHSLGHTTEAYRSGASERMKHTRDFKLKGFKGNERGHTIQAPFTTLEEMLRKLPEHIGFNIEMKYPMLFESEQQEMDTYAVELNSFVDTVLKMVYDLGNNRNIIFSSFHPDICLLLSLKQPSIPILFLTDAGGCMVGDVRASSLQEAIRFASRWNLLGIVAAAEPLVLCPRLVRVVKESGLVCVSYGTLNNDPENVKRQVNEGIDAVIVDSVLAVRKGLTSAEAQHLVKAAELPQEEIKADGTVSSNPTLVSETAV